MVAKRDYGSTNTNNNGDEEQLLVKRFQDKSTTNKNNCKKWISSIVVASLLLIGILYLLLLFNPRQDTGGGSSTTTASSTTTWTTSSSSLGPPQDLGLRGVERDEDASPSSIWGTKRKGPLPTNSWYLNLVSHRADYQPDDSSRVYTTPYIIDTASVGNLVGIRIHWPITKADSNNIQMVNDVKSGLTLGTSSSSGGSGGMARRYQVDPEEELSPLGITLRWMSSSSSSSSSRQDNDDYDYDTTTATTTTDDNGTPTMRRMSSSQDGDDDTDNNNAMTTNDDNDNDDTTVTTDDGVTNDDTDEEEEEEPIMMKDYMKSPIVRGMPYATMQYYGSILPSIYSENALASDIVIDDNNDTNATTTTMKCGTLDPHGEISINNSSSTTTTFDVQNELLLHFLNSDFTWIVFFSHSVQVECGISEGDEKLAHFKLNVISSSSVDDNDDNSAFLTVRIALIDPCTTGKSSIAQHCEEKKKHYSNRMMNDYIQLLRSASSMVPTSPKVNLQYSSTSSSTTTTTSQEKDESSQTTSSIIEFDWAVQDTTTTESTTNTVVTDESKSSTTTTSNNNHDFIMFALPHHQQQLVTSDDDDHNNDDDTITKVTNVCVSTFHGKTCLIHSYSSSSSSSSNPKFQFQQPLLKARVNAKRPPAAEYIPILAQSIKKDLKYRLSDNIHRGAADTYFSGKILARQARTIVLAEELLQLATTTTTKNDDKEEEDNNHDDDDDLYYDYDETEHLDEIRQVARKYVSFSKSVIDKSLNDLKTCVQVWFDPPPHHHHHDRRFGGGGSGKADYVYDTSWGGLVNCGCTYTTRDEFGHCNNTYPNCPALVDVNEDFGNGYYNDHHFHYGYHIYAAAIVAQRDAAWGRAHFDQMLLYIRDYANPFVDGNDDDKFFPPYRQKDWWLGSSWASGIVSAENSPHGRNQESSSEAIAAYESMALFGSVMKDIFAASSTDNDENNKEKERYQIAKVVQDAGNLLMSTEVDATHRYWHVWSNPPPKNHINAYPSKYDKPVVGMLYETMASFQTWFAPYALVSYGIQLMPLTPIVEERDDPKWAQLLYPQYVKSCQEAPDDFCIKNGWTIVQAGLCATASTAASGTETTSDGGVGSCLEQALNVPPEVYETDGGMGNSLSNTIWYIATRPTTTTKSSRSSDNVMNDATTDDGGGGASVLTTNNDTTGND